MSTQPSPGVDPFTYEPQPLSPNFLVRFPRPGDPVEGQLVQGGRARRRASIDRLTQLVPGIDWELQGNITDAATLVVAHAPVEAVAELDVLGALDAVGWFHDPSGGLVNLAGDGGGQRPLPPSAVHTIGSAPEQRLLAGPMTGMVRGDTTAIINGLDRYSLPLKQLNADVVTAFAGGSNTNCYVSFGESVGFGAHWDDHDVLILQTHGHKHWEIYAPTALSPVRPNTSPDVGSDLVWSGDLEPGSALLIPRGWGHRVDSSDELSIHLTVSIHKLAVSGMLSFLATAASNWPILRADVPFDPSQPVYSYDGSVFDEPDGLRKEVDPLFGDLIERSMSVSRAQIPAVSCQSLAASLEVMVNQNWDNAVVDAPFPGGVHIVESDDDGGIDLAMGGFVISIDRGLVGIVARALAGPVAVSDLAGEAPYLDQGSFRRVVEGLVRAGVLHVLASS